MRAAVYCATRNIYHKIIPSLKSLLKNSSVEKAYLLVEDDHPDFRPRIPSWIPVECINVSGQTYFPPDGANSNSRWTYMVLMRLVLCKILPPDLDKVLSLDCDTIINENIDELWDLELEDNYFAAVREVHKWFPVEPYYNAGMVMWNLKQMRDGKADEILAMINVEHFQYPDQDAMNIMCHGHTLELQSWYNYCRFTTPTTAYPKIIHYANTNNWYEAAPTVQLYKALRWEDVRD